MERQTKLWNVECRNAKLATTVNDPFGQGAAVLATTSDKAPLAGAGLTTARTRSIGAAIHGGLGRV